MMTIIGLQELLVVYAVQFISNQDYSCNNIANEKSIEGYVSGSNNVGYRHKKIEQNTT